MIISNAILTTNKSDNSKVVIMLENKIAKNLI